MTSLESTLAVRGNAYGLYENNAHYCMIMRNEFRNSIGWAEANPSQRLALDEIALKIARLLSKDANDPDTWLDIAGYAEQGRLACR